MPSIQQFLRKNSKKATLIGATALTITAGLVGYSLGQPQDEESKVAKAGEFGTEQIGYGWCTYNDCNLDSIVHGSITFSPDKGSTAPYFKDPDDVTVTLNNLEVSYDTNVNANNATDAPEIEYQCKFAVYQMGATTPYAWLDSTDATPIDYDVTSGCTANFAKSIREKKLNWDVEVQIVKKTDGTTVVGTVREGYSFRIAGVAIAF